MPVSFVQSLFGLSLLHGMTWSLGIVFLPTLLLPRAYAMGFYRFWCRACLLIIRKTLGISYRVEGTIPEGPFIIASKHQSIFETLAFNVIFPNAVFILKKELMAIPLFGWYLWRAGNIAIDRASGSKALRKMQQAAQVALERNDPVVIYPQGTRVRTGKAAPYLPGVAGLYGVKNCPVLPIALNSGTYMPRSTGPFTSGEITIRLLEPIPAGKNRRSFMTLLEKTIEQGQDSLEPNKQNDLEPDK